MEAVLSEVPGDQRHLELVLPLVQRHPTPTGMGRFTSVFSRKGKPFNPQQMHGVVMGAVIGLTMNEACVQFILKMSVDRGHFPHYANDTLLYSISLLETLLAPYLCWTGYRHRPRLMLVWMLLAIVTALPMFFLDFGHHEANPDADLCAIASAPPPRSSPASAKSIVRLVFLIVMALVNALGRSSIWAHGVAILDDYSPASIVKNLGLLIAVRLLVLVVAKSLVTELLEDKFWLQILLLVVPLCIKTIILVLQPTYLRGPDDDKVAEMDKVGGLGFLTTVRRVFTNCTAMVHMVTLAIFSAAIWGFVVSNTAAMTAKYQLIYPLSQAGTTAGLLRLSFVILMVLITGYQYGTPLVEQFQKTKAMRSAVCMTIFAAVFIVITSLLHCDTNVNGLGSTTYSQPQCGFRCGCPGRGSEFVPVCVLDEMTTYYSPCHAGCTNRTIVNGVTILTNCACSVSRGNASLGACAAANCHDVYTLHEILFVLVLIFAVTAFTLHGVVILRSVDERDKSAALGVTFSMVALFAPVAAHALYTAIQGWTCAYKENGRCELQNSEFPLVAGLSSATLALVSAILNVIYNCIASRRDKLR